MPQALLLKPFISAPLRGFDSVPENQASSVEIYVENGGRVRGIRMGMLVPRKFMQKRKKVEVFEDAAIEKKKMMMITMVMMPMKTTSMMQRKPFPSGSKEMMR